MAPDTAQKTTKDSNVRLVKPLGEDVVVTHPDVKKVLSILTEIGVDFNKLFTTTDSEIEELIRKLYLKPNMVKEIRTSTDNQASVISMKIEIEGGKA